METNQEVSKVVKVEAEDPKSSFPTIMIEKNLGSRNNPDFESFTFRWTTKRKNTGGGILALALGGNTVEKRHCIQSFHKDTIALLEMKTGVNLNELLKKAGQPACRIAISEITAEEYDQVPEDQQWLYSEKENPSTNEVIGKNGRPIYRKTYLADLDVEDEYVVSDGKPVKSDADDLPA